MKVKNPTLAAIAALALVGPALAAVIAGGNGSFETVTLNDGFIFPNAWRLNDVTITGWTYTERVIDPVNGATWFMGGSDYGTASDGN